MTLNDFFKTLSKIPTGPGRTWGFNDTGGIRLQIDPISAVAGNWQMAKALGMSGKDMRHLRDAIEYHRLPRTSFWLRRRMLKVLGLQARCYKLGW